MMQLIVFSLAALIATSSAAMANPLALVPLIASAITTATLGAGFEAGAVITGLATVAVGAATVSGSRRISALGRER